MSQMELFRSDTHFILVKESYSLWWDKQTGEFSAKSDWQWASANELECLGIFYGVVGKIEQSNVLETRLMLIKEIAPIGQLHGDHTVYKIKSVAFLHLGSENFDIGLLACPKHHYGPPKKKPTSGLESKAGFAKTWGQIKSATTTIKTTTQHAAALATSQVKSTVTKKTGVKEKEKFEKRILEELQKIFTETDSFFFCPTRDITNTLQRLCINEDKSKSLPLWHTVDERFFWNKHMLQDIINLNKKEADQWILPIIQGYVQIEQCHVDLGFEGQEEQEIFNLAIISRRSRFRAGTRYKRRGVDEDGNCANYVETEQLVWYHDHQVSFAQVRGSVPIFWSQPGYKYRPPPRIDRDVPETRIAFEKHFEEEFSRYGPVCIVNLVEQAGKEKVICDAYSDHVLMYNNPDITYATFDFHEYCRGMHFENVSILVSALSSIISEMSYCWRDKQGAICLQKGVFRVNCIDCLDRTNVVQTALGKAMMEYQFSKLGLIPPDGVLPSNIRQTFQLLWANNGDIISKQYAGTNALKGDYTRTGERKFTGLMKDGMNSANRYYLNRFKDVYRQATIDMMQGNHVSEEMFHDKGTDEEDHAVSADHVKLLIEDCKKLLIPDPETVLNSWGLIDADPVTGDPTETEIDSILILTHDSYYVADYDDQIDKVTNYQRVLLSDIILIECGYPENTMSSIFKNKNYYCIRINYKVNNESGYYHMFRSTNLRFFNTMAIAIKTDEEVIESLKSIAEAVTVAMEISGLPKVPIALNVTLDKRKSKVINTKGHTSLLDIASFPVLSRNVSETQLNAIKCAGTKALSNMSEQFSKLSHSFTTKKSAASSNSKPKFTVGDKEIYRNYKTQSSSSGSDENIPSLVQTEIKNDKNSMDAYTSSIGIIMGVQNNSAFTSVDEVGKELTSIQPSLSESQKHIAITPEIKIQSEVDASVSNEKLIPPNSLNLPKKMSHSSGEVDYQSVLAGTQNSLHTDSKYKDKRISASDQDLTLSITTSQSESMLKNIKTHSSSSNVTSPVSAAAKEILSPFSKLAKGVQSLGANLDPRKLKSSGGQISGIARNLSEHHLEERQKLIEKWTNCKSRLIAL